MNCRQFRNHLLEYQEGTLSPGARAAAGAHLAACGDCRAAVERDRQFGRLLTAHFRQKADALSLSEAARNRMAKALERDSVASTASGAVSVWWNRFAWRLGFGVCLALAVLLLADHFFGTRPGRRGMPRAEDIISVDVSYCVPTRESRKEGDFIFDTLDCETVVARGTL